MLEETLKNMSKICLQVVLSVCDSMRTVDRETFLTFYAVGDCKKIILIYTS